MKKKILVAGLLSVLFLTACNIESEDGANNEGNRLQVTASFYPMYEFATQVAGDQADVEMILSSNQDAHSFEPSAQDVAKVSESDVFVYSSDEMEFWVPGMLETVENDELIVARAIDGMNEVIEEDHDHSHEGDDHNHEDEHSHDEEAHDHDDEHSHGDEGHDHEEEHGSEPEDIIGISGHYHTGDTASLQANVDGDQEITWVVNEDGEETETSLPASEPFEYSLDSGSVSVYYIADGEESDSVSLHVDDHDDTDPHIWLDLVYAEYQVNEIRDAFIEADPDNEESYNQNAENFVGELQELNAEYNEAFEGAENRNFVVQHEAFSYLANRYDLNQVSIGGLSTQVEPSPSRIVEVGNLVEEYDVPVIYYQEGSDSAVAQTVANETGTETAVLYDLEILSSHIEEQGLGYIEVMRQNLEQLKLSIR